MKLTLYEIIEQMSVEFPTGEGKGSSLQVDDNILEGQVTRDALETIENKRLSYLWRKFAFFVLKVVVYSLDILINTLESPQ